MDMDMDDHELLGEFAQGHSEAAFRRLVERHVRMVLSAARRMVNDDHLAQDVTQNVFTTLAQKARVIRPPQTVGGWLYNTTRNLAMHAVRGERRRREREETAVAMQSHETHSDTDRLMEQLEPAMAELDADDRDTLVLRYLEDRNLREVGAEFGISEDAARMRANRALERLRALLDRRGVSVTPVLLAAALVSTASSAVPAGLAGAITTTAVAGTILTTVTTTTMNWINAKAIAAIVSAAVLTGTGTYLVKQNEANRLRDENGKLLAQQAALTTEIQSAQSAAQLTASELDRSKKDNLELLRLRNEVGQLRRDLDSARQQAKQQPAQLDRPPSATVAANTLAKGQVNFVGYATPEAALQTVVWATMSGNLTADQVKDSLSPELLNDQQAYAAFEMNRKQSLPVFKSVDVLAKKTLDENRVEFKLVMNADLGPNAQARPPAVMVLPLAKVGDQWKLGGNPMQYREKWDTEGLVQRYGQ